MLSYVVHLILGQQFHISDAAPGINKRMGANCQNLKVGDVKEQSSDMSPFNLI